MDPTIQFKEPEKCLQPYIECYWCWRIVPVEPELDAIFPDASPEFIVHLGKPPCALKDNGEWFEQPRSFLMCAAHQAVRLAADEPVEIFAIRFRPWGVGRFSDQPMSELLDREVPINEVFQGFGENLVSRLNQLTNFNECVELANTTFNALLTQRTQKQQRILALANSVAGKKTTSHEIANAMNMSERSFRRHWAELVGIEHRMFMSLMRFHRAIAMIEEGFELSVIALECGYADQPHLAREVKRLSGLPSLILRKKLGEEVYHALFKNRELAPWHLDIPVYKTNRKQ